MNKVKQIVSNWTYRPATMGFWTGMIVAISVVLIISQVTTASITAGVAVLLIVFSLQLFLSRPTAQEKQVTERARQILSNITYDVLLLGRMPNRELRQALLEKIDQEVQKFHSRASGTEWEDEVAEQYADLRKLVAAHDTPLETLLMIKLYVN